MGQYQYEWWNVDVIQGEDIHTTLEIKAKSKEHAIKQIKRYVNESNSDKNAARPLLERITPIKAVLWDTLTLDRKGYQRRF